MKHVFLAVFNSVWKRKETKIFLAFSLYPLVFYISSFFPDSEFMKLSADPGTTFSFIEFFNLLFGTVNSITLPVLALYYLTHTVFRREIDDSLLFLYKDIDRKKIFVSKLVSLCLIVTVFGLLFLGFAIVAHYGAVVKLPLGSHAIFPATAKETLETLLSICVSFIDFYISIFLATFFSLYFSGGVTLLAGVIIGTATEIIALIGGPIALAYPTCYNQMIYEGKLAEAVVGVVIVTFIYVAVLSYFGFKKFKNVEY
ncbi:MAG: hypothetical protein SOV02_02630 [Streptococcus infantarius]|nr:hypothetical protein [Streptococcus infantarius]